METLQSIDIKLDLDLYCHVGPLQDHDVVTLIVVVIHLLLFFYVQIMLNDVLFCYAFNDESMITQRINQFFSKVFHKKKQNLNPKLLE